jgi:hypothetical protein
MTDLVSTLASIFLLLGTASFMIVAAFTCFSFSFSKFLAARKGLAVKLILGVVLGVLAIYGTLMGTRGSYAF